MESGGTGRRMKNKSQKEMHKLDEQLDSMSPFDVPLRLRARRGSPAQQLSTFLCSPVRKDECKLGAIEELEELLLQTPSSAAASSPLTFEEAGAVVQNDGGPKADIQQRKRGCSFSGLVTNNDFFIPRLLTSPEVFSPSSSGRDMLLLQSPRKEILPDSLRRQHTANPFSKHGGSNTGNRGNWTGGFLERAIKVKERCTGHKLRQWSFSQDHKLWTFMDGGPKDRLATELEMKLREQGMAPVYYPEKCANIQSAKVLASLIADLRVFLIHPAPKGCGPVECHIRRHASAKWLLPTYMLYFSDGDQFLLSARRRKKNETNYVISLDEEDMSRNTGNYFGKLRSNFTGSEYWFYDKGATPVAGSSPRLPTTNERIEMGAIKYHLNLLGLGGPRKMTAIIPSLDEDGNPHRFQPGPYGAPVILDIFKRGKGQEKMVVMQNKHPHWNKQLGAYCLNFNGRVTKPSIKNFQLIADNYDYVILQFGKIGRNLFTMDYQHPMSALQAFAICLSSLDPKLVCE